MRSLRMALVLLLASSLVAVVPGEGDAVVPGAVGRFVYVSDATDVFGDIYVRGFAGGTPIQLTTSPEPDYSPHWSPDGEVIAFARAWGGPGGSDVFVIAPDGSGETNLTNGSGTTNIPLAWSPDSMRILIRSDRSGQDDLWTIRPDGSDPVRLTNTPDIEAEASWSPDGSTIVFSRETPGGSNIWAMDADGSNGRSLTGATGAQVQPDWSPDGSRIVYLEGHATSNDITVMNADGSNQVDLLNTTSFVADPRWLPDGTRISYMSDADGDSDIWSMNADGTGHAHVTDHVGGEWDASWESVNRPPVVTGESDGLVHRGQSVDIDVLENDYDPDGETIVVGDIVRMPAEGAVTIGQGGTLTYLHDGRTVPPGHAVPYTDSFDYRVDDERMGSTTGTVQIWIYPYFDDVPLGHNFFDHVLWLATQGITYGCNPPDNTLFCPADFVTRGQMAAFLVRARGYTAGDGADLFVDDSGSVFEPAIDRLGWAGVTKGCNPPINDRFCPSAYVTRGQMAAFLVRAFGLPPGGSDMFIDDNGSVFENSIDTLGATGVSLGCNPPDNDRFCPDDYVTREQMAAFISRASNYGQE